MRTKLYETLEGEAFFETMAEAQAYAGDVLADVSPYTKSIRIEVKYWSGNPQGEQFQVTHAKVQNSEKNGKVEE